MYREDWKLIGGIAAAVISACAIVMAVAVGLTTWECNGYSGATGKPTKTAALTCYIHDGNQWYAWEEYKHRFVANGNLAK